MNDSGLLFFPIVSDIQAVFIQQEVIDTHKQDAILIVVWRRSIPGDDDPFEEIPGQHQGSLFLLHFCLIRNRVSGLDVVAFGTLVTDEVNLQLPADAVAFFIGIILYDDAHIHIETADF